MEDQQQTQPTYGNRIRDTLVEGERSRHCAIPATLKRTANERFERKNRYLSKPITLRLTSLVLHLESNAFHNTVEGVFQKMLIV